MTSSEADRASSKIADELRTSILTGRIRPGDFLPSEWSLVESSGQTRTAVREALLILKREGLIATRRGRTGGSVVVRPDHEALVSSIDIFLQSHNLDPENSTILEAREAIEPWSASLAAQRRTPEDLDSLDRLTTEMEEAPDLQRYLVANLEWHVAVARASRNAILLAFMNALGRALYAQTDSVEFNTGDVRATAVHAHRVVNDAIRAKDSAAAQRRMARHIHVYGDAILHQPPVTAE